jgi:hypothetical protein
MEGTKVVISFIIGILIMVFIINVFKTSLPDNASAPLIAGVIFIISFTLALFIVDKFSEKSKEISDNIQAKLETKREMNELKSVIEKSNVEYLQYKNTFQYFSNEKLSSIYKEYNNGLKKDDMELLALEEELVKRKLISHSPMHEKIYGIKNMFK